MSPIAELGPIDPQITELNPLENRLEQFSPMYIESTMSMIRNEYEHGSEKLADSLMQRLQFPLTLGGIMKTSELSEQYLTKLLESRMLQDKPDLIESITKTLSREYASHGFCITSTEAKSIGLVVNEIEDNKLDSIWSMYRLNKEKRELLQANMSDETQKPTPEPTEDNDEDTD